jgi:polysaccharide biosynthesis protein PslH
MKVLFIVSRFPYPLEKGDKLRAYQHIVNMHSAGHEVHLVALSDCFVTDSNLSKLQPYCASISILRLNLITLFFNLLFAFFRNLPLQVGYFYSKRHQQKIDEITSVVKPDAIYCQLIRTALFVKNIHSIPKMIDYQDAFSRGTFQRIEKAPLFLKPLFVREYRLVKLFEQKCYDYFKTHLIISKQDLAAMEFPQSKSVNILPNGIDTHFFHPSISNKEYDITFVGNMNYPPNVDAAVFLVKEIMPLVWKEMPKATLQLAGANPDKTVKALASSKVKITGWVDDIRDCYTNTLVFIAPMRIGTGLQNKLLEAMAMRVACVTTPISFEPLGAKINKDILVGENKNELARHLLNLLIDSRLRDDIAEAGHQFVVGNYSMNKSATLLNQLLVALK